ncbi:AIR carboxylase family protein [Patescibacteria group bacterium]|nr:AIR carboxylase family protein [Patescibacteria group bacterium]
MAKVRKVGIMIGSDSDLPQCLRGLKYLREVEKEGLVEVKIFKTSSFHRNQDESRETIKNWLGKIDAWILGAGHANHLTGSLEAYARYVLNDIKTTFIGVAFEADQSELNRAAILSITCVPGTQVVFNDFIGEMGFLEACAFAVNGEFPEIKKPESRSTVDRSLEEAIEDAEKKLKEQQ